MFLVMVSFGKWLKEKRKAAGFTQDTLAESVTGHGVKMTAGYISNLERDYYKNQDGQPSRPSERIVNAIATALNVPLDEARLAAGYAPTSTHYVSGFEIQLPDDVTAVIPHSQITSESEAAEFREAFLLAMPFQSPAKIS